LIRKILLKSLVIFICTAQAYSPLVNAAQLSLPSGDLVAPVITQPEYTGTVKEGENHVVNVHVTDNMAVKQVVLYYRTIGAKNYHRKLMRNISNTDNYRISISAKKIKKPGLEYYIQAVDTAGNTLLHGYSFSPLSVKIIARGGAVEDNKSVTSSVAASAGASEIESDDSIFTNKWFWIGVGVLVAGAAASGGGGGGGGDPTATLTINAGEPAN